MWEYDPVSLITTECEPNHHRDAVWELVLDPNSVRNVRWSFHEGRFVGISLGIMYEVIHD